MWGDHLPKKFLRYHLIAGWPKITIHFVWLWINMCFIYHNDMYIDTWEKIELCIKDSVWSICMQCSVHVGIKSSCRYSANLPPTPPPTLLTLLTDVHRPRWETDDYSLIPAHSLVLLSIGMWKRHHLPERERRKIIFIEHYRDRSGPILADIYRQYIYGQYFYLKAGVQFFLPLSPSTEKKPKCD